MQWAGVKPQDLQHVWPLVLGLLEQITARSDMDLDWVYLQLREGKMQLWLCGSAEQIELICLTQLDVRPKGKVAIIWGCAGINLEKYSALLDDTLVAWARQHGAMAIESTGRFGWERWLGRRGWRRATVTMRKEL